MSQSSWSTAALAVHVAANEAIALQLEREARSAGTSVIHMDLKGVHDRDDLAARLAQSFLFPHDTSGLDAAVDLISDLEWFGNSAGYLVIVHGLDQAAEVVTDLAGILPAIVDRWRSQGKTFVVVLVGDQHRDESVSALARANQNLEEAGRLAWAQPGTGAVTIVDHSIVGGVEP